MKLGQYFNTAPGTTESTFAYNPAGQIRSETRTSDSYAWTGGVAVERPYSVNGQNQYTAAGPASFAHDANGNLPSDGTTSFTYDSENRLVSASGAKNATLAYDPLGRLFQISSQTIPASQFLYDGDELVAEYNDSGVLQRRYIHGDGNDDPLYAFEGAGLDQPRFPHVNHQGSVIATAGPGAVVLNINTYDEYGIPGANNQGRFQYTGQAWLPELGMYYYKARIYSPTLGRFLQTDPIGYEDQVNLYAYVANDPLNARDPTGEMGEKEGGLLDRSNDLVKKTISATSAAAAKTQEALGKAGHAVSNAPGNAWRNARDAVASVTSSEKTTMVGRWMSGSEANKMIDTGRVQEPNEGHSQSYVTVPASSTAWGGAPKGSVYLTYRVPSQSLYRSSTGRMYVAGRNSLPSRNEVRHGRPPLAMPKATFITMMKIK